MATEWWDLPLTLLKRWVSLLTSLSLDGVIYKMGMTIPVLPAIPSDRQDVGQQDTGCLTPDAGSQQSFPSLSPYGSHRDCGAGVGVPVMILGGSNWGSP